MSKLDDINARDDRAQLPIPGQSYFWLNEILDDRRYLLGLVKELTEALGMAKDYLGAGARTDSATYVAIKAALDKVKA